MKKVKVGYVSDNDDPTSPQSGYTKPTEGGLINAEQLDFCGVEDTLISIWYYSFFFNQNITQ